MRKGLFIFFTAITVFFFYSCKNQEKNHQKIQWLISETAEVKQKKTSAIKKYIDALSLEKKIAQLFIVNINGNKTFYPVEKYIPGGFLFFSYNLAENPLEIMNFTDSVRLYCCENDFVPPFLAIDQEGGYVSRLKIVNGPLPSAEKVAKKMNVSEAYKLYSLQALQMRSLGFDMNIAPVVEVKTQENAKFLDARSFGDYEAVKKYSTAFINAFENNRVGAVAKHFPGNTNTDPHTNLPEISLSWEKLEKSLLPFNKISTLQTSGVLMSHARTLAKDEKTPACLSHFWVNEELKEKRRFQGIVFSDDIFMDALKQNGFDEEKACVMALDAGIDCIMISEKRIGKKVINVLIEKAESDSDFLSKINEKVEKILRYKVKSGILKFQRVAKEEHSDFVAEYLLVTNNAVDSIENRLVRFDEAKKENVEMYLEKW